MTRSGVGPAAQAFQFSPQSLARAALSSDEHDPSARLRDDGRAVVDVAGAGNDGADAGLDRPQDLDDAPAIADQRLHPIAGANLRRGFRARSIHDDVAALARSARERPRLYEAHRAKPAIDAGLVGPDRLGHGGRMTRAGDTVGSTDLEAGR